MYVLEAGSGQKAFLTFSEKTSEVSALLVSKDVSSKAVSNENLPKDLKMIKSLDSFNGFLENAQARGAVLSDGEAKLYVMQKGVGGSDRSSPAGGGTANWTKAPPPNLQGNITLPNGIQGVLNVASTPGGIGTGLGVGYSAPVGSSTSAAIGVTRNQFIGVENAPSSRPSYSMTAGFRFKF